MKTIAFFEIPCTEFNRAVEFYERIFGISLPKSECGEEEKMAFFSEDDRSIGAISYSKSFKPSADGVLISFNVDDINKVISRVIDNNGKVVIPKTKIEADYMGYFAVIEDCEGNHVGLYSE